jgi:urease beta subunit
MIPGEIISTGALVEFNLDAQPVQVEVTNTGPVAVHVTAHFHVFEANPKLRFNRRAAYGMRLDTHAKGSVRFEPGERKVLALVPIEGNRAVHGFNGAVNGPLDDQDVEALLAALTARDFLHEEG